MNYGIKLIEMICEVAECPDDKEKMIEAYNNAENCPDNFAEGYETRYAESIGNSLGEILEIFYDNTFMYEESVYCEGYGKLIDFIYALDVDVEQIVDSLDEITLDGCFYDIEGEIIDNDEDVRMMRNLTTLFNLYEIVAEDIGNEKEITLWSFMREYYPDSKKVKAILELCGSDDVEEIWTEWLICSQRAV